MEKSPGARRLLRARVPWEQWPAGMQRKAPVLWEWYRQLVRAEESFKTLKGDLNLRPIHHQIPRRVELIRFPLNSRAATSAPLRVAANLERERIRVKP